MFCLVIGTIMVGHTYMSKCLWVLHSESPFNITGQLGRNGSTINLYYHKTSSTTTSNFHDSTWPTNNNDNDDDDDNNDNEDTGHVAPSTVNITNNIMLVTRLLNLGDRSSSARFYWIVLMKNINDRMLLCDAKCWNAVCDGRSNSNILNLNCKTKKHK